MKKFLQILLVATLLFVGIGVAPASADLLPSNDLVTFENSLNSSDILDLKVIDSITNEPFNNLNGPVINDGEITPLVLPLLAAVVIRAGVPFVARLATGQVVKVSGHAATRAVERKVTGKMLDNALNTGTKYVDILSSERIAWAQDTSGVAVLLNPNTDVIDTVYIEDSKKLKWFKNSWKYIGDLK